MRSPYLIVTLPALLGLALSLVAYLAPFGNTGVDGTLGALLALFGAAATVVGAGIALSPKLRGGWFTALNVLTLLAAGLTAIAAYFLMQLPFAAVMALAVVALVAAWGLSAARRPA